MDLQGSVILRQHIHVIFLDGKQSAHSGDRVLLQNQQLTLIHVMQTQPAHFGPFVRKTGQEGIQQVDGSQKRDQPVMRLGKGGNGQPLEKAAGCGKGCLHA